MLSSNSTGSRDDGKSNLALATPRPPSDLTHHFSRTTQARKPSSTKQFYSYFDIPSIGNLSAGFPDASFFPFDTIEAQVARPARFKLSDIDEETSNTSLRVIIPNISKSTDLNDVVDVTTALQYGTAHGYPPLHSFLKQFTCQILHPNIPYLGGPEIIPTTGSTDGFSQLLEAFTNTWSEGYDVVKERQGLLCEQFTYMHAIQSAEPRGLQIVPVEIDDEGIVPSALESVLSCWDESKGKRPHLLYTIPTGQNPSGSISPLHRRQAIYWICQKYDVLIIEDDPCFTLQYPSATSLEPSSRCLPPPENPKEHPFFKSSGSPFIDSLEPSYLNIDTDGRVVRLDTFSKTVAPGCRLGWITAQPAIIESLLRITETSTGQPSGFVQAMMAGLLMGSQPEEQAEFAGKKSQKEQASFTGWKVDGWVRWLEGLRGRYESRMNRMCKTLDDGRMQLPPFPEGFNSGAAIPNSDSMYTFRWPRGGMSVWIRMNFETHPLYRKVRGLELSNAFWMMMLQKPHRVLVTPGHMFSPTNAVKEEEGWKYFRLCFAPVTEDEVELSSQRFVRAAHAFWMITNEQHIQEIQAVDPQQLFSSD
ncbi:putative aromatic amino acid aminotransferase protein [Botrytis fragariae]|uniref:Putative aromatic amino acid aminotransferase protein n=1 Tax=Botrytis fragariae TaxID=1964551 RepID=A0A8H6EJS4_9HELO|nr:putative aromatic amino acid aminotransferase protein [Botrytis fragariae]KAF5874784.1 putative aromatic amino acid aminotransferase protein [Botrytis fragariae]